MIKLNYITDKKIIQMQNHHIKKPQRPADDDCCGGGSCCPCVWDAYHEAYSQWQVAQNEKQENEPVSL